MIDLLPLTLEGKEPAEWQGETPQLRWRWLGEGVLELTPRQRYRQALVVSAGVHGNETAPIELLNQLIGDLLSGRLPLAVRLLVVLPCTLLLGSAAWESSCALAAVSLGKGKQSRVTYGRAYWLRFGKAFVCLCFGAALELWLVPRFLALLL